MRVFNPKSHDEPSGQPCPEGCGGVMTLKDSRFGLFYGCSNFPRCKATHGAHPDGRPLGIAADKATKAWRIKAHDAFDQLWKGSTDKRARRRAYAWLRNHMNMTKEECHIGRFDTATCQRVIETCKGATPETVRLWVEDGKVQRHA